MIASAGLSKTRWRASVSSTTPRLGARWPPVRAIFSTRKERISAASASSWAQSRARRSDGEWIDSSKAVPSLTGAGSHQFRQLHAEPGARAEGAAGHAGQLVVRVPGAGGDVQVDPGQVLVELLDEHAARDRPRLAVVAVAEVGRAAGQQN